MSKGALFTDQEPLTHHVMASAEEQPFAPQMPRGRHQHAKRPVSASHNAHEPR